MKFYRSKNQQVFLHVRHPLDASTVTKLSRTRHGVRAIVIIAHYAFGASM